MQWDILHVACFVSGIGFCADGIGSTIIHGKQYHNLWFDGERIVRAAVGVFLAVLALLT
ncbi:MAG TPA: hypothetical protein VK253_08505 [Candidatus Binatia bacterium]|nr:hypothetical protein [Candidatus Binatia bacterium]